MAIANVALTDTFDEWRGKTNSLIVQSEQTIGYVANTAINANAYSNSIVSSNLAIARSWANTYADSVGVRANTYADSVGVRANTYANVVGVRSNSFTTLAYNHANAAFDYSNSSFTNSNSAYGHANVGFTRANSAYGHANAGYTHANSAYGHANGGFIHANSAYGHANSGYTHANSAYGHANAAFNVANTSTFGKQTIWIPANAMTPRPTSGPSAGLIQTSPNLTLIRTFDFDSAVAEFVQFSVRMPKRWNEGSITASFLWSHDITANNFGVVWSIQAIALSDTNTIDSSFGAGVGVIDTGGAANTLYITSETAPYTIENTPTESDLVVFQISRQPTNAADTMAIDAKLQGVNIFFTTNAATDD